MEGALGKEKEARTIETERGQLSRAQLWVGTQTEKPPIRAAPACISQVLFVREVPGTQPITQALGAAPTGQLQGQPQ